MKNVRFWEYINGSMVKVTLKPHQSLYHHNSSWTEEGWQSDEHTWRHEGERIILEYAHEAQDCDGRYSRSAEYVFGGVESREYERGQTARQRRFGIELSDNYFPVAIWQNAGSRQRDYTAEAMGY